MSRFLFGHAGFSGIFLEGDTGARAFVGPGATRGRLSKRKKEKSEKLTEISQEKCFRLSEDLSDKKRMLELSKQW